MKRLDQLSDDELSALAERFAQHWKERQQAMKEFWESDLCKKMVQDMVAKDECLSADHFAYFEREVRDTFGWHDVPKETITMFINVMADGDIGVEKTSTDESCPFANISYLKRGLWCRLMHGQGTSIVIEPADKE